MAFVDDVTALATAYLGEEPRALSVNLAIEQYKDCRHFPKSYTAEMIGADMTANISKIAYATIEIDAKIGIEGQTSHNENGLNRGYGQMAIPKAYASVIPFANVF